MLFCRVNARRAWAHSLVWALLVAVLDEAVDLFLQLFKAVRDRLLTETVAARIPGARFKIVRGNHLSVGTDPASTSHRVSFVTDRR